MAVTATSNDRVFHLVTEQSEAKLWDLRLLDQVKTIGQHTGRVSCLLATGPESLVAASCPDNIRDTVEKGSFTFWDLRKV